MANQRYLIYVLSLILMVVFLSFRPAISDLGFQWLLPFSPNLIACRLNLQIDVTDFSDQRFSSRVILILLNRDDCLYLRFVSGVISHRRYLRLRTDEFSPHYLSGDVIWVFDPGIKNLPVSLEGFDYHTIRIGLTLPMTGLENDVLSFYLRLEGLVFMKGKAIVTNRQRRVLRFQQHDHEPLQSTYHNFLLSRVMRKAFRSLIYMMLAYFKCMKRGLNRFILLPVRLLFGKQGYFHFFIGIVFNSLYLFHRLYLNGSKYHVNSYD